MTQINAASFALALSTAINARKSYELAKQNEAIQSKLDKLASDFAHVTKAEIMLASNVDANFINRQERSNARYNVYAAQKVENAVCAALKTEALNHYSRAILATMRALEKNESALTFKDAESACSLNVKVKDAKREKIIVKYQRNVDAKTAATQASSSLNALATLNVITETRDAANNAVFKLASNDLCEKLLARCD